MLIKIDRQLASAAGQDAANRNMRKEGRHVWNEEDWNIAAKTFHKLMKTGDQYNEIIKWR